MRNKVLSYLTPATKTKQGPLLLDEPGRRHMGPQLGSVGHRDVNPFRRFGGYGDVVDVPRVHLFESWLPPVPRELIGTGAYWTLMRMMPHELTGELIAEYDLVYVDPFDGMLVICTVHVAYREGEMICIKRYPDIRRPR